MGESEKFLLFWESSALQSDLPEKIKRSLIIRIVVKDSARKRTFAETQAAAVPGNLVR